MACAVLCARVRPSVRPFPSFLSLLYERSLREMSKSGCGGDLTAARACGMGWTVGNASRDVG